MKTYPGFILLTLALLVGAIHTSGRAAPPTNERMAAPVVYKELMLIISTKDGVAAVVFGEDIDQGVTYRYRFLPKDGDKEQSGEGNVFEKYERTPGIAPNGRAGMGVKDVGGQLYITAGPIKLEWSYSGDGRGWIYYQPEDARVQIANANDFEKCDLTRFAK